VEDRIFLAQELAVHAILHAPNAVFKILIALNAQKAENIRKMDNAKNA